MPNFSAGWGHARQKPPAEEYAPPRQALWQIDGLRNDDQQRSLSAPKPISIFGDKKQIFGVKSQATIFNPPLAWEDG
jgi:hypothetical protein